MAKKGSNTQTATSSSAPNPVVAADYYSLLNRAQNVASTPYQPYGGEFVAPINQQQYQGIGGINQYANFASPYISGATGYANAFAQPLTAEQIQQYMNPYTQQVINATQADFDVSNREQQSALLGNAAAQNALGGNRVGVAQASLAGQQARVQNPIIAGLRSQAYQQALQTAEQQKQDIGNAAFSLANIGISGQQAGIAGAGAQIGAGTIEQQNKQAMDTAAFQEYMRQQGYPYQQLSWLAGIDTGVGSNLGGTSTTTQQGPQPNRLAQNIGAGLAGIGMLPDLASAGSSIMSYLPMLALAKRGGRIRGYAGGGDVAPYSGGMGWIPTLAMTAGRGIPTSSISGSGGQSKSPTTGGGLGDLGKGLKNFSDWLKPQGSNALPTDRPNSGLDIYTGPAWQPGFADSTGGFGDFSSASGGLAQGGFVSDEGDDFGIQIPRHFADGGVPDMAGFGTGSVAPDFNDRFGSWIPTTSLSGRPGTMASNLPDYAPQGTGIDPVSIAKLADEDNEGLPDESGTTAGINPLNANAQADEEDIGAATKPQGGFFSPAGRAGLISAGLNMMAAARGPHPSSAIGVGAVAGFGTYQKELALEQKQATEKEKLRLADKRIQQAEERANRSLDIQTERLKFMKSLPRVMGQTIDQYGNRVNIYGTPEGKPLPQIPPASTVPGSSPGAAPSPGPTSSAPAPSGGVQVASSDGSIHVPVQPYDYAKDAPVVHKGDEVPDPVPAGGRSSEAIKIAAAQYFQTGKFPAGSARGTRGPIAQAAMDYRNAVENYASAFALSRGLRADEIPEMWRLAPRQAGWIMGADGRQTGALGTVIDHIDTARDLFRALNNSDVQLYNRIKNAFAAQFGSAAPTNVQAAAQIVGAEIIKAVGVAGGGGEAERSTAAQIAGDLRRSPEQANGALDSAEKLIAGQLRTKTRQAKAIGLSEDKLKTLVGDRAWGLLSKLPEGGAAAPAAAPTVGDMKRFKQGWGRWDGTKWVPAPAPASSPPGTKING